MTTDRILELSAAPCGFSLYPEYDADTHRAAASLVRRGEVERREKVVGEPGGEWLLVTLHRIT